MSLEDLSQCVDGFRRLRDDLADGEAKQRATDLIHRLESEIEHLHDDEEKRGGLIGQLRHFTEQLEVEHPQLTETSNRISMLLSGMGI